jgi:hypothetical protein
MQKGGWRGVTVGECLGDKKENWMRVDGETTLGNEEGSAGQPEQTGENKGWWDWFKGLFGA